jgi:hypothetical protein
MRNIERVGISESAGIPTRGSFARPVAPAHYCRVNLGRKRLAPRMTGVDL